MYFEWCTYFLISCLSFTGPLLYHFTDMPNESSIELSYDDFREVVLKFNFEIVVSIIICYYCVRLYQYSYLLS